ncbi:MAG: diguanylate cyclase, partial [Acetobacterium sp.]|nr:diguanylate cyclase [Acetobacterium sp.]
MHEAQRIKVLTIEDDEVLRRGIATYFEDSGFTVYEASNAQDGLTLFRQYQPNIVFTDLCMPHGNGLDLLPVLHAESPHTPLVVLSGAGRLNDAVQAMKLGAWDYIDKPVRDLSTLENLVYKLTRQAINMREQHAAMACFKQSRDVYKHYDVLTGLPNRTFLAEHFGLLSARKERLALIHLDLDNFKLMNATMGSQATDKLLQKASVRIRQVLAEEDMVARIGSDEFAILTTVDEEGLGDLITSLKNVLSEPFRIITELFITVSMGVVSWPSDGTTIDELLKHADMSMLHARKQGNNHVQFYNPAFGIHIRNRIELENNL